MAEEKSQKIAQLLCREGDVDEHTEPSIVLSSRIKGNNFFVSYDVSVLFIAELFFLSDCSDHCDHIITQLPLSRQARL